MSELTKQALKVDNNQSFPNNNAGLITPTALRAFNENMIDSTVNQTAYTADSASFNSRINAITGSATNTGSLLTTASFDNGTRNLTFTKGDSSQFSVNIPDVSGSTLPSGVVSGSSQINYPQISNIPAGIVSGSAQLTGSFVTTNTPQVITGLKNFGPTPDGSIGISMQNATRLSFGSVGTNRISSPDSNTLNIETINNAPTVGSPNTINLISGVNGSVSGDGSIINIQTRGAQVGQQVAISSSLVSIRGNTILSGGLDVSGGLTSSLQQGFVLVGNASGRTQAVSTGSFGGGTGNGFPFSGSAVITGSLSVSETIKSQVYMNPQTLSGFTIPTGNNAMLVGPVAVSGSIVVEGNSNLLVLSQITASVLPSGVVSGSSQLTASYDLRYALSGSAPNINTGSFATTGSNTFIGNQTITGSLFLSSSNAIKIIVPNFPGAPAPGGVSITGSVAIQGNFALDGGNFVVGQINTAKITSAFSPKVSMVTDVVVINDSGVGPAKTLGVSGSAFVSESLQVGGSLSVSGSAFINNLQNGITDVVVTYNTITGELRKATLLDVLSSSLDAAEFWSTTTQSGSAGVSGSITFNNSGSVAGISVTNNSRVTVSQAGTYNIQFSAQVETSAGADTLYVWFKKNGVNITDSASKVVLANNTAQIMTVNIFDAGQANDYYELVYQTLNGHARVLYEPASGNIPAIPSVILTINQIR